MSSTLDDPFDLQRFVAAQDSVYAQVKAELAAGAKASHWDVVRVSAAHGAGAQRHGTARHYGLASIAEALAYWRHPVLGARLKECCDRVLSVDGLTARQIFGATDELKFCSCLTLFGGQRRRSLYSAGCWTGTTAASAMRLRCRCCDAGRPHQPTPLRNVVCF